MEFKFKKILEIYDDESFFNDDGAGKWCRKALYNENIRRRLEQEAADSLALENGANQQTEGDDIALSSTNGGANSTETNTSSSSGAGGDNEVAENRSNNNNGTQSTNSSNQTNNIDDNDDVFVYMCV